MRVKFSAAVLATVLAFASHVLAPPVLADGFTQKHDDAPTTPPPPGDFERIFRFLFKLIQSIVAPDARPGAAAQTGAATAEDAAAVPSSTFYLLNNAGYTMQPGEPTEGGRMTRSGWGGIRLPQAQRIVLHTYGSDIDTVLAAYQGSALGNIVRVAGNDNKPLAGLSTTASLVQFDVAANTDYLVQMGGRNSAEGDIQLNAFSFPPGGGLSVFLAQLDGFNHNGRDYVCLLGNGGTSQCPSPRFILHNSTGQVLTVTANATLGAGVTKPAPLVLNPGAVKSAEFLFTPAFDTTTQRTVSGKFTFTARNGAVTVSRAEHRALVVMKNFDPKPDALRLAITPGIRTGYVNEAVRFRATLTNTGATEATGCHFRSQLGTFVKTEWRRIDPVTGAPLGGQNQPTAIPALASRTFTVWAASQRPNRTDPDPRFPGAVMADCANTAALASNVANRFDIAAVGTFEPAEIEPAVTPATDVLAVGAGATGSFRVTAVNRGPADTLTVTPRYVRPFGEDAANLLFTVKVCRTATPAGACLAALAASTTYTAARNVPNHFRVVVTGPSSDPGFDPTLRRVFLNFEQVARQSVGTIVVGAPSIAVKRN